MRVKNFSAGPSGLPLGVLKKAQDEFLSYHQKGFNIMEVSHRGKDYEEPCIMALSQKSAIFII